MTTPPKIACLGECMIELSDLAAEDSRARLGVAGDTLNTAIYLARLMGDGAEVHYLTALGDDAFSDRIDAFIRAEGVRTDHVARIPGRLPGLYAIELDAAGERRFHYWRSESAARHMFDDGALSFAILAEFDVLYVSGISLAILPEADRTALIEAMAERRDAGAKVVFDSNYRPRLWASVEAAQEAMSAAWKASNLGLPSVDDEASLWGPASDEETMARVAGYGVAEVVLKRGGEGPLVLGSGAPALSASPVQVVDTTAAGDSFNAGYIAARLQGGRRAQAAVTGHRLAGRVIGHQGAIIPRSEMP